MRLLLGIIGKILLKQSLKFETAFILKLLKLSPGLKM